ncbi:hypothetical protein AMELA_G00053240 [Ameiurus melas]|uniref:Uncharacterized protein n=1 Tax=Ameiurus melas TaxID=219545 RepID=A0A7J6B690_AMEME|nr:hypothetical protein AMELA_G00053240 [Ameiurus melas]
MRPSPRRGQLVWEIWESIRSERLRLFQNEPSHSHLLHIPASLYIPVRPGDVQRWQRRCQRFCSGFRQRVYPRQCARRTHIPYWWLVRCEGGISGCSWCCSSTGSWRMVRFSPAQTR